MKHNRIEYLDSLRGLASLSVVLSHFFLGYGIDSKSKLINFSPLHFFYDGFAAVTFFFVLSGYVLTLSLSKNETLELNSFFLKRIFRIIPSYIFVLFFSLFLYFFFNVTHAIPDSNVWLNTFWGLPLDLINFLKQIVFIKPEDGFAELVPQNWSLLVEIKFSFLIPFLFLIYKKTNFTIFSALNLVLYLFFDLPVFIFHFSLGIFLAMNQDLIITSFTKFKIKLKWISLGLIILMYTYRFTIPMYYYYFAREYSLFLSNEDLIWAITGLGSFSILVYCFTSVRLQSILNLKIFRFIGKISYAIYLSHMIFLIFVLPKFISILNSFEIIDDSLVLTLSLLLLFLMTIIFSYLITFFIEIPIANYGNKISKKNIHLNRLIYKYKN